MAGAFYRDHAGADRVFRMADGLEKPALKGRFDPLENLSAKAFRVFLRGFHLHFETSCIHRMKGFPEAITAVRNPSDSPPVAIIPFKNLVNLCHSYRITLLIDDPPILNLYLRPVLFDLPDQHPDSLEDVQWLKAGDHRRPAEILCNELIRFCSEDGAHMAGEDKTINLQLF